MMIKSKAMENSFLFVKYSFFYGFRFIESTCFLALLNDKIEFEVF